MVNSNSMDQRWLRWCLTAIVVLLTVIAIELSVLVGPAGPAAYAQVPDSGLQRKQLLDGQLAGNRTLERILTTLRESTIKVKVVGTDKDMKDKTGRTPEADKKK